MSAKDITNIEDVVVDENRMILSMRNTRELATSSPFGKVQKHENNEECGTARTNIFPEEDETATEIPTEFKETAKEMIKLFPTLLPI